jgi:undecaprenyl diphosphate synthase
MDLARTRSFSTKIAQQIESGEIKSEDISEELIHENLYLPEIPDPDLILRTSGEKRLSNFLLWQAAYSEFYFSNALWPDFTTQDLDIAIASYLQRERRYGAIVQHENPHH